MRYEVAPIFELASRQHGVVSAAQLRGLGLSPNQIARRARQGWLARLHRGVYAVGHRPLSWRARWMAAVLAGGDGAVLSHRSAAALWQLVPEPGARIDITVPTRAGRAVPRGLALHRSGHLPPAETTWHHAIPATTPARTLLDLAAVSSRRQLERAIDEADRLALCRAHALRTIQTNAGRAGATTLASILDEHEIGATATPRVVVEVDGQASHGTRRAFQEDRARDARLTAAGYRSLRFTYRDVVRHRAVVANRVRAVLRLAGKLKHAAASTLAHMSARSPAWLLAAVAGALLAGVAAASCGGQERMREPAGQGGPVIGFIYVDSTDDLGYNQATFEGTRAIRAAFPRARLIQRENVPEGSAAERAMEQMIAQGAKIVFATSFGHLEPALAVAARHPQVTFLHQGGLKTAANLGTYFGTIWEAQYAAGQAAGLTTRSDRLGYVAAFPIAQALLGVNAYQRGAHSVNPRVRTEVTFTGSWCNPAAQRRAARRLLAGGADVLSQHQDCTGAVIEQAAASGAATTGQHYDARALAPGAWITGATWNWGPLFVRMVRTAVAGRFASSPFAGRYRGGAADGTVKLTSFGPRAGDQARARARETFERIRRGELRPFDGPVRDQQGRVRIPGRQPGITALEEIDYLVEGVVGTLPGR